MDIKQLKQFKKEIESGKLSTTRKAEVFEMFKDDMKQKIREEILSYEEAEKEDSKKAKGIKQYRVYGSIPASYGINFEIIEAKSKKEAMKKARKMMKDGDYEIMEDKIYDSVDYDKMKITDAEEWEE